jgi:PAS domain S-box-containing protein
MKGRKVGSELRRRAEQRLRARTPAAPGDAHADARALQHDLDVHRIELELQNDELRAARDRLEASLARYTELFDFAPVGYVVVDAGGTIRELNFAAARLLGAERRRIVNTRFGLFVVEPQRGELADAMKQVTARAAEEAMTESRELTLDPLDGEPREARLTMAAIHDPERRVLVTIEDITAQKSAEALRTQRQVQGQVLDNTRWELDAARRLHEIGMLFLPEGSAIDVVFDKVVEAAIAISGADRGDLQITDRRSRVTKVRAQHGFEPWWAQFWETAAGVGSRGTAMARGERVIVEDIERSKHAIKPELLEVKRRAGVRAVVATPLVSRSGPVIGAITLYYNRPHRPDERALRWIDLLARQAVDLFDRASAEQNEAMLRRRFEALDRLSVLLNRYVSEHRGEPFSDVVLREVAELARSVTRAEYAGLGLGEDPEHELDTCVLSPEGASVERLRRAVRVLAGAAPGERSVRHHDADVTILASASRDRGRLAACLCVARARSSGDFDDDDRLTLELLADRLGVGVEEVRLTRETLQAMQARENLLAVVSHDLRSPLTAIRLSAGLIKREGDRQADVILRCAGRMTRLIEDLLQAAVIEAGKFKVDVSRQDVLPVVRDALDALTPLAAEKSIQLDVDVPAGTPPILADRQRVLQVLSNLVGNAIKFVARGGRVVVRAWAEDDEMRVAVSDNGPGIAEDQLAHIFDRYERGKTGGGVGLGLYIAKGIVEAHRGRIWVESRLGAGTTFYLAIPLAGPRASHAAHA